MAIQSVLGGIFLFAASALASCECGYKTNTGDVWQYAVHTDFSTLNTASFAKSADWAITVNTWGAGTSNPYSLNYTASNVNVANSALSLTCSAYDSSSGSKVINAAQIVTKRSDIKYGSFRSKHKFTGGSGAVGALFFYSNDDQEVDMELLTRDPVRNIHFTNQPDETISTYMPNSVDRTTYAEYRFDWLPNETRFYINNCPSGNLTKESPSVNGSIMLNSWANGGSFSGATVPSQDAILSTELILLYFNTSDTATAATWKKACKNAKTSLCLVDPQALTTNKTVSATASSKSVSGGARRARVGF